MQIDIENTFIYLLGFPGTGKYTIAQKIIRDTSDKCRLVDNHLINNPVFSLIQLDGKTTLPESIWDSVGKIWDAILDTITHISPADYSFVLTNALFEDDEGDLKHYNNIKAAAEHRKAKFFPVRLIISDVNEHVKRITSIDRTMRFKETNPDAPKKYMEDKELIKIEHPNLLTLDITNISATDAAKTILEYVQSKV